MFNVCIISCFLVLNYINSVFANPVGTEEDPIYTDNVPISAGTAVVIGTAGAAIVISNACLRSWRIVSLSRFHSLRLARIHILVLTLLATAVISCVGALKLFTDDTRALGGLMPLLGVLSPFIFFAGAPDFTGISTPTRTRLLTWVFASPFNVIILLPGILLTAACVWIMVKFKSWDVLAITFSLTIAVLTRTDPLLYYSWDGRGSRWQWGRLLPSPVRMSAFRFIIGRIESETEELEVEIDAMEVPLQDSISFEGKLYGETKISCDYSLAASLQDRGVLASLPVFYEYVDSVWTHIIHDVKNGSSKEQRNLDQCAASCILLIITLLRDSLTTNRIGADVWLLLAIFRLRIDTIGYSFTTLYGERQNSMIAQLRDYLNNKLSCCWGRTRTDAIDDAPLVRSEEDDKDANMDENESKRKIPSANMNANDENDIESGRDVHHPASRTTELLDEVESLSILHMHQSIRSCDNPPLPDGEPIKVWTAWIIESLNDMYIGGIYVLKQLEKDQRISLTGNMSDSLHEWFGDDLIRKLSDEISEVLELPVQNEEDIKIIESNPLVEGSTHCIPRRTVLEEANDKVEGTEVFTYIMLCMASREIISNVVNPDGGVAFESAAVDAASGELNGRLKAQNMSRKVLMAQIGLWTYVALGQTASALLSRN